MAETGALRVSTRGLACRLCVCVFVRARARTWSPPAQYGLPTAWLPEQAPQGSQELSVRCGVLFE